MKIKFGIKYETYHGECFEKLIAFTLILSGNYSLYGRNRTIQFFDFLNDSAWFINFDFYSPEKNWNIFLRIPTCGMRSFEIIT